MGDRPSLGDALAPSVARRFGVVPLRFDGDVLVVAAAVPPAADELTAIEAVAGRDVRLVLLRGDEVARLQHEMYGSPADVRPGRYAAGEATASADATFQRRLAASAGLEFTDLPPEEVEVEAALLITERLSRQLRVVATSASVADGTVRVAVAQPFDADALRLVEAITALRPVQVLAPPARIDAAIDEAHAAARVARARERDPEPRRRLGELLVEAGVIDEPSLRRALALQRRTGEPLGRALLALGLVGQDRLAATIALQLRLPYVIDVRRDPRPEVLALVPENVCRTHRLLPLEVVDGVLVVAMADPLDEDAGRALRAAVKIPTRLAVASDATIGATLERLYAPLYVELSTTELLRRRPDESAYRVLSGRQTVAAIATAAVALAGLVLAPTATLTAAMVLSILFYSAIAVYKFILVYRTVDHVPELAVAADELALLDDRHLPHYTILVPLYREAVMVRQLVDAINALDYPKEKLDVKLLLEEDDHDTIAAVRSHRLGPHFRITIVPDAHPKTKPKACNYGLLHARGEYVVIYDAEDVPDPDQLKKAVLAFRRSPPRVVCMQAKLNYANRDQNLLTRWFTAEYSQWFDLFLPGLDATRAPVPLGGTSNHFPVAKLLELGAWDPFNVTEDADVGIRLARSGYRTAIIDSTTYEEATSRVYNWIRQRSRWVKGYVQTWLVHMRHPVRLWRELGPLNFVSFQLVVGGTALTMLLNPVFWGLTSLWALTEAGLIREIFPGVVYFAAAGNLLVGNFLFTYLNVAGALRRGYDDLVRYALFSPLYWALMSVGAWKGFLQLVTRPSYWEKTVHGMARVDASTPASGAIAPERSGRRAEPGTLFWSGPTSGPSGP
ncbi:MAG TPA: glycosyltransferase family 2 protein [Gaiellaceae bacterium]